MEAMTEPGTCIAQPETITSLAEDDEIQSGLVKTTVCACGAKLKWKIKDGNPVGTFTDRGKKCTGPVEAAPKARTGGTLKIGKSKVQEVQEAAKAVEKASKDVDDAIKGATEAAIEGVRAVKHPDFPVSDEDIEAARGTPSVTEQWRQQRAEEDRRAAAKSHGGPVPKTPPERVGEAAGETFVPASRLPKTDFRHQYRQLTAEEKLSQRAVKSAADAMACVIDALEGHTGECREIDLARTRLEESVMWAMKGLTATRR